MQHANIELAGGDQCVGADRLLRGVQDDGLAAHLADRTIERRGHASVFEEGGRGSPLFHDRSRGHRLRRLLVSILEVDVPSPGRRHRRSRSIARRRRSSTGMRGSEIRTSIAGHRRGSSPERGSFESAPTPSMLGWLPSDDVEHGRAAAAGSDDRDHARCAERCPAGRRAVVRSGPSDSVPGSQLLTNGLRPLDRVGLVRGASRGAATPRAFQARRSRLETLTPLSTPASRIAAGSLQLVAGQTRHRPICSSRRRPGTGPLDHAGEHERVGHAEHRWTIDEDEVGIACPRAKSSRMRSLCSRLTGSIWLDARAGRNEPKVRDAGVLHQLPGRRCPSVESLVSPADDRRREDAAAAPACADRRTRR